MRVPMSMTWRSAFGQPDTRSSAFCTMEATPATALEGRAAAAVLSQKQPPFFLRPALRLPIFPKKPPQTKKNHYQSGRQLLAALDHCESAHWLLFLLRIYHLVKVGSCDFFFKSIFALGKVSFCHKENVTEKVMCKEKFKRQNTGFPHFSSLPREMFMDWTDIKTAFIFTNTEKYSWPRTRTLSANFCLPLLVQVKRKFTL